jgi:hypothetical protein
LWVELLNRRTVKSLNGSNGEVGEANLPREMGQGPAPLLRKEKQGWLILNLALNQIIGDKHPHGPESSLGSDVSQKCGLDAGKRLPVSVAKSLATGEISKGRLFFLDFWDPPQAARLYPEPKAQTKFHYVCQNRLSLWYGPHSCGKI